MAADEHEPAAQHTRLSISQTSRTGIRVLALGGELDADNIHFVREALTPATPARRRR
ncbi:hypothetical protein ACFYRN_42040 [Streptomyces sp. NPDC005227]|uniref:hypothetical protein n=1 Tax=Streptomyces sp. NPDC005227 TaxID=3364707 RepID=UPI0036BAD9BB